MFIPFGIGIVFISLAAIKQRALMLSPGRGRHRRRGRPWPYLHAGTHRKRVYSEESMERMVNQSADATGESIVRPRIAP